MRASSIGFFAAAAGLGLVAALRGRRSAPAPTSVFVPMPPIPVAVPGEAPVFVPMPPIPVVLPADPAPAPAPVSVQPPSVEAWRPYVRALSPAFGFGPRDEAFIMNYITMESGGRPCSVGFPGEVDAQGQPLESGIGQFMSPHDIALAGTTVQNMRRACSPRVSFPGLTRASPQAEIAAARALEEAQTRPLTETEKLEQVTALLTFLRGIVQIVERSFRDLGVSWSRDSADYLAMVKGYHAGQSFPTAGLAAAKRALGRPPASWREFVSAYLSTIGDANLRARHAHALDNATRAGAGSALPWIA